MERAESGDLPGKAKPIRLSACFQAPAGAQMAQTLLKNAGIARRKVELLLEIRDLKRREFAV